jgi:hypothetical protein
MVDSRHSRNIRLNFSKIRTQREFSVEDAELIAFTSEELRAFQKRHPLPSGSFVQLSPEESESWIKAHPEAFAYKGRGRPPKSPRILWQLAVQWEQVGKWVGKDLVERITITMDSISRKIVETKEERIVRSEDDNNEDQ